VAGLAAMEKSAVGAADFRFERSLAANLLARGSSRARSPRRPGQPSGTARSLRRGVTTVRDVGSYDDIVFEARQAMRYGESRRR
jgi:hypothetical protein